MRVRALALIACLPLIAAVSVGCAPTAPKARPPEYTTVRYVLPGLTPAEGSPQDQSKGNVRISCNATPFTAQRKVKISCRELPTMFVVNEVRPYEVKRTPFYEVGPDYLRFKIKVYNGLAHVLRLEGTVVSFRAGSDVLAVDKSG